MLVECGFVRAQCQSGEEFTFTPSLRGMAQLATPRGIVELYVALHGPHAEREARYVLASLCDQDDPSALIGCTFIDAEDPGKPARIVVGEMPAAEQVIIARHLMQHGIVGNARPQRAGDGKFTAEFNAAEFVSAARVHLGLSSADAEALSMTEFQLMCEQKFGKPARDVPTREEYDALMARIKERRRG